jgi:inosine-uridine nucleoside N-ribohydrolase
MGGDVETMGELTLGATVFDRRRVPSWRCNMEVAVDMQTEKVVDELIRHLNLAAARAKATEPET